MSNTVEQATLTAPDISCAHCVATINKAVGSLPGILDVETSEATKQVSVRYDPGVVSVEEIEAVMDEEGYPVQK